MLRSDLLARGGLMTEVMSEDADVDFSVGLALLQENPCVLDDALGETGERHLVFTHVGVRNQVLVVNFQRKLIGIRIRDDEIEDFVPPGMDTTAGNTRSVLMITDLYFHVGIGLADEFSVGKVASLDNANIKTAHSFCEWILEVFFLFKGVSGKV